MNTVQVLEAAAGLLAAGVLLAAGGWAVDALTRRRAASIPAPPLATGPLVVDRVELPVETRRADAGPPAGLPDRRRVDVGPGGRHRRPAGGLRDGQQSATGILRAVRAADGRLPEIPRPTRAQLRDEAGR